MSSHIKLLLLFIIKFNLLFSQQPKIYFEVDTLYNNTEVLLYKSLDTGGSIIIARGKIVNGKTAFNLPKLAEPISTTYKLIPKDGAPIMESFIVTNTAIKIKKISNSGPSEITGGENDFARKNRFLLFSIPQIIASNPFLPNLSKALDFNSTDFRLNLYWKEYESNVYELIRQRKNSYYLLDCFYSKREGRPLNHIKQGFLLFSDSLKNTTIGKKFKEYISNREKLAIGTEAPNFTLLDSIGRKINLSEFYTGNKILLLDFWASWCGPCKKEIKYLKTIYDQVDTSKVSVISISIDNSKAKWIEASKKESFIWRNYWAEGGDKSDVAIKYGINTIPRKILISSKGSIVDTGLDYEKIDALLTKHNLLKKQ